jgi:hypothetical protein
MSCAAPSSVQVSAFFGFWLLASGFWQEAGNQLPEASGQQPEAIV